MLTGNDLPTGALRALALSTMDPRELHEVARSCDASLRVVGSTSELDEAIAWQPQLLLVDDALITPHVVEIARRAAGCVVVVLVDADPDPDGITGALAAGVDTIALRHPAQLRRLFTQETSRPAGGAARPFDLPGAIIGASASMREVWRLVLLAARTDVSVLVTGETGAGKELVAQALHRLSPRRSGPFVAVNCAALPETLLESELFGHEKGSFTGASTRHKGRFELAHGGTLFLDEIGDLPANLQAKLLRVLQERSFERVGGTEPISVDVRVIAATHRDLHAEIARGGFRADLFYRLNVLSIHVPPLRDRKADVPALWSHFLAAYADGATPSLETSLEVKRRLVSHDWPGNVRELCNVAQHVATVCRSSAIAVTDLPPYLARASAPPPDPIKSMVGLTMKQIERAMIRETLEVAGTVRATAEMLGLSVRTVHYRLREYRSEHPPAVDGDVPASTVRTRTRVCVAEDNDEQRMLLTTFLRSIGYDVIDVSDGSALLREVGAAMLAPREGTALPDLVVSDLCMPGATGLQFLEGIRAQGSQLPVVLVTAFGDAGARERARALGATAILDKPVDLETLEGVIRQALAN